MNKFTFKLFITGMICLFAFSANAQTRLFEHPQFDEISKNHKSLAILPFEASIKLRPKQMKEITAEQLKEMAQNEGLAIQNSMYTWFLTRQKRGKLSLNVQDPKRTRILLQDNNITDPTRHTPEELAKILGVDAVVSGTFETDKPMSDGASIALGLLVGFWGSTNTATVNMSVNNATDGELLWNYNKRVAGSLGSTTDALINKLMRKASRRLAYTN
ncbi:hypothetical protein APR41_10920 [Salegentibacter salinarum]|uniref:Secreted protein n=1 Tax=Salegentibacter salinarum TaxID=447422 RepID=A0A2N0TM26_9FLAO|nr:hypothetical protein [Salegentibacter salinarum]PKD15797.1 hypothetical protein APR41_10920 [Salegentibacter salinarum]SKB73741.1 hypothetical protein SAMN05660903_02325 [Salegentibacter salinarum]